MLSDAEIQATETALINAMTCAVEKGWTIARNTTYESETHFCCAIGAIAVCNEPEVLKNAIEASEAYGEASVGEYLADSLGYLLRSDPLTEGIDYSEDFVYGFVMGFDSINHARRNFGEYSDDEFQGYLLGRKLAAAFIKD